VIFSLVRPAKRAKKDKKGKVGGEVLAADMRSVSLLHRI